MNNFQQRYTNQAMSNGNTNTVCHFVTLTMNPNYPFLILIQENNPGDTFYSLAVSNVTDIRPNSADTAYAFTQHQHLLEHGKVTLVSIDTIDVTRLSFAELRRLISTKRNEGIDVQRSIPFVLCYIE